MSAIIIIGLLVGALASGAGNGERAGRAESAQPCKGNAPLIYYREIGDGQAIVLPQILEWPCGPPLQIEQGK